MDHFGQGIGGMSMNSVPFIANNVISKPGKFFMNRLECTRGECSVQAFFPPGLAAQKPMHNSHALTINAKPNSCQTCALTNCKKVIELCSGNARLS
jgi:hypothetical protein